MALIRWLLGRIILSVDFLTRPRGMQRSAEAQARVDAESRSLALYQFEACPFCVKTRRAMRRLSLNIELRDARRGPHGEALVRGGGERKVPCLRIENAGQVRWMYESDDIIAYLEGRFAAA